MLQPSQKQFLSIKWSEADGPLIIATNSEPSSSFIHSGRLARQCGWRYCQRLHHRFDDHSF